jgi:hypothetical protein
MMENQAVVILNRTAVIISEYLEPGRSRDPEATIQRLIEGVG